MDHLHAATAPQNKFDTPRIKYFDRNIIKALTRADKRKSWQGGEPFGHCDFQSATDACYASARENHGLRTSLGRAATRHEDTPGCHGPSAPAPESHAPQPPPNNTKDCHADADDRRHCDSRTDTCHAPPSHFRDRVNISIQFPRIKDTLSSKIQQLSALERPKFEAKLVVHDQAVEEQIATIKHCLTSIVDKQFDLKDTFYEMIDDVLRAQRQPTMMKRLNHPMIMIMPHKVSHWPCTDCGTQLTPETQLDTHVSVQDPKVPTAAAPPTSSNQNPCNTGGSEATGDVLQPNNGSVFDERPCGHGSSVSPTTPIATIVKPTRTECALALREFLCTRDVEIDRTVIDFGGYISACHDVKESFADGTSLDSVFMQYFIECVRYDDSANLSSSNTSRLILDTNVGAIINIEELEQHSQNPQIFDPVILQNYLAMTLPSHPGLEGIKTIMVPMLRGGHWSLYVVNTVRRCIDILDSNPSGPALGGTTWRTYHNAQVVDTNVAKLPWSRLIMNRLNKALQRARPKSSIPKFGNYKIDLAPNCPTINPGSNDCGFFVTRYIQFYDFRDASISLFLDPDISREHRSLLLHYLTFHRNNKSLPLPPDIQRFCHSDH
ncbi:hypothetical protein U9M48_032646 [Paspalum notatum var. saurae]|uniref:Ubiquitin-like protease family profile domain-containing protein n=1 Tax=Paspalum notatum var. saurae TaxID=547442 RepID=A0AAQ3X5M2_PASNO